MKIKKLLVSILGFTILFVGIVLIVLPGPAFILIPLGLLILSYEYKWAQNLLNFVKRRFAKKDEKET
jgi:uncharacterized protein (TIGR02611 family)